MIFQKRTRWCVRINNKLYKFDTREKAEAFVGKQDDSNRNSETSYQQDVCEASLWSRSLSPDECSSGTEYHGHVGIDSSSDENELTSDESRDTPDDEL